VVELLADDLVPCCTSHDVGLHGRHVCHDAQHARALLRRLSRYRHRRRLHRPAHFPEGTTPFKEYPAETVRRLDQEQKDFRDVAEPLGSVKDKVEFDEFLARLNAGTTSPPSLAAEGGADGR
jgi:Protein of unknown function (DUF2852)